MLTPEYRRLLAVLEADSGREGLRAKDLDLAARLGLELVPAKVEGVRMKAKRLVARGRLPRIGRACSRGGARPGERAGSAAGEATSFCACCRCSTARARGLRDQACPCIRIKWENRFL